MLVSVVLPVYNTRQFIEEIYQKIHSIKLSGYDFEIIFVDDNCPANSWQVIEKLAAADPKVKGIKLSRNFGQHFAITAGLESSKGEVAIVMDCDLQEDPMDIPRLLNHLTNENADIVLTLRHKKSHGFLKGILAKFFYFFMRLLGVNNEYGERVGTFSCLKRKVINEYLKYNDAHRHYIMIVRKLGFKLSYLEIVHHKRNIGSSSYPFKKLLKHSIDGIIFQTNRLLQISMLIGILFIAFSIALSLKILWSYYNYGSVAGYTSLILSIFMCSGVILFILGVHGIYIGKIFDQSRKRPLYIIDKKIN